MEIPMGLGMALAQNEQAMEYFAGLPEQKKDEIIQRTCEIQSKDEMQAYVQNFTNKI
nr:hypothetical protein [uncultured Caproiciproducens sp.]